MGLSDVGSKVVTCPKRACGRSPAARLTLMAVRACYWSPARAGCRDYAVAAGERFGVWGGLLPAERRETAPGGLISGDSHAPRAQC